MQVDGDLVDKSDFTLLPATVTADVIYLSGDADPLARADLRADIWPIYLINLKIDTRVWHRQTTRVTLGVTYPERFAYA